MKTAWAVLALGLMAVGISGAAPLEVHLDGVTGKPAENIRAVVDIFDLTELETVDPETVEFFLARVAEQVRTALLPFGYYNPRVVTDLSTGDRPWTVRIEVDRGEPVRVASMAVRFLAGRQPAELDFTLPGFPLGVGDRLVHQRYESGKRAFRNALYDHGYLDATPLTQEVRVDPTVNEAYVTLIWDIGAQHHFGEVTFAGSQLSERFMTRFVPFQPGTPFSQDQLLELSARLRDSNYFSRVSIEPELNRADHQVPVRVQLTPNSRTLYRLGVTFGTDSGPGVEADVSRRWVNAEGHTASGKLNLGQRRSEVAVRYDMPDRRRFDSFYQLGASLSDLETDAADSRSLRVGVSRLHGWRDWRRTDAISFLREKSDFGDSEVQSNFLIPALTLSRTRSDGTPIPTEGLALRGTLRGAAEGLASDTSLLQLDLSAKRVLSPSPGRRILLRGRLGLTWTDDFDVLPASLRFFAGGDRSIRGYDYESLGPRGATGDLIGGRHLVELSAEYEIAVHGPWRGAVFVDGGNALSDLGDELELGAGFGVRYASPIGLIRADLGFPVTEGDSGVRLHFVVGPDL